MRFECGDLERALGAPELMPEAKAHLKNCSACRTEYRLWNSISSEARGLHEEWETPELWDRIEASIKGEPKPRKRPASRWTVRSWKAWSSVAAACILGAGLILFERTNSHPQPHVDNPPPVQQANTSAVDQDFLTDQALREVEQREQAYRSSIEKLSRLAQTRLAAAPPSLAVNYRDKLLLLDSAIAETRSTLEHNRFNVRLQADLADLYKEKQLTLQELVTRVQKN